MIATERPYLTTRGTLAFAHRGGSLEHPENTMVSFGAAVDLGYLHLETDTQLTRDGVLLAFHDETLDRVTDLTGPVAGRTLEEIRRADAAHRFSQDGGRTHPLRGTGIGIPTLEEVLVAFPQTRFNIDAKTSRVLAPLAALIERLGAADRICIGSFSDGRVRRFRRLGGGRARLLLGRPAPPIPPSERRAGLHLDGPARHRHRAAHLPCRADAGLRGLLCPGAHVPVGSAGRRPRLCPSRPPGRAPGPRLDHRRPRRDGAAAGPWGGRAHERPAPPAQGGPPGPRPVGRGGGGWPEGIEPSTS